MHFSALRLILISALLAMFLVTVVTGCGSRAASAQKLFDKGQYQAVIDKYPDLEIARRARAKLADQLLEQKNYSAVLSQYPDTPAAYRAQTALAQQLFDQGNYKALLDSFPHSTLATMARERLADSLFAAGQLDSLIRLYPDTPRAKEVKEERARTALAQAKKLRGDAQKAALEAIQREYTGTEAFKEASQMLGKIREADMKKQKR